MDYEVLEKKIEKSIKDYEVLQKIEKNTRKTARIARFWNFIFIACFIIYILIQLSY